MENQSRDKKIKTNEWIKESYSGDNNFEPETKETKIDENSLIFAFAGNKLLLIESSIPLYERIKEIKLNVKYTKYIGKIQQHKCFALEIDQENESDSSGTLVGIRQVYAILPESYLNAAIYGFQIVLWNKKTKYCGHCGSSTEESLSNILVKTCPNCKQEYYPKISPSVIVAIAKDDELLLAQHKRTTNGVYTILAGFVNPGESLEECVRREIKEEAGIEVTNIRYFGSQPWPFPDSLMIGFTADYEGGQLKPDQEEIIDLKWFKANEIPEWPDKVSIARALIDDFIENNI